MTLTLKGSVSSVRYFHFFKNIPKKKEYFARKLVGYSQDQMYNVISDVRHYKKFVPFCTKSRILSEIPDEFLKASLEVGFPPIVENYTSNVTLVRPKLVKAVCKDGNLFTYLETTWKFTEGLKSNPESCIIEFYINFQFKSLMHSQVATLFFDSLVRQMERAFLEEAKRRYGKESIPIYPLAILES